MSEKKIIEVPFPVGLKVTEVRWMTQEEVESEGWDYHPLDSNPVLVFEDGSIVYASSDPEGNGPGMLFGNTEDGQQCYIVPLKNIKS